ncbi:hypothetical protein BT93_L3725 [Corymbia citriodora subsp. variegata]|uniref:Uncharacterized protein n=1 Tax=Corymbia citriodora subsp. variegata TaxID=360336 RepID=A0A8T0CWN2_CORYI|nr:hypothetical protein BT93_L3725 [Corymbia citriodora subsp. variegata]
MLFLTTQVILLSSMQCHAVQYTVTNNAGNSTGNVRFSRDIGIPYSLKTLTKATDFIWRVFHQNVAKDRKSIAKVSMFVENMDGVAYTINDEIHWNGNGQAPSGLIEGFADFVRLRSGYVPGHWVRPGQGDRWDQGYDVTAHFLDYCNGLRKGFVAKLNKKMRTGYSDNYFVDLLGKSVDQLWKDYKAKYAT